MMWQANTREWLRTRALCWG